MKKRSVGRPSLPDGQAKTGMFALRLSGDEKAAIDRAAESAGKPVSQWSREAMMNAIITTGAEDAAEGSAIRARASFVWGIPGMARVQFVVTLYRGDVVSLDGPTPYVGIVSPSKWLEDKHAIKDAGAYWSLRAGLDDTTKKHLLLTATNAIRRELGLPPHPATKDWPGTE